jgi:hypothetical protein
MEILTKAQNAHLERNTISEVHGNMQLSQSVVDLYITEQGLQATEANRSFSNSVVELRTTFPAGSAALSEHPILTRVARLFTIEDGHRVDSTNSEVSSRTIHRPQLPPDYWNIRPSSLISLALFLGM